MIYVDEKYWGQGVGTALLMKLIKEAPDNGFWCLYSSIFSSNEKSLNLHRKCGFRTIGYRERIAKDRFGNWTDTTLMEYRFPDEVVKDLSFEDKLPEGVITRAGAKKVFYELRKQAAKCTEMTMEEIDAEIATVRAEVKR